MYIPRINVTVVYGGLLDQTDVDVFVNPWNRNFVPRWLFVPGGVSKVLKEAAGEAPWKDLAAYGLLGVGEAVMTKGGHLPQDIIHVAGVNLFWKATDKSIERSVKNAVELAWLNNCFSVAMPLIGAGVGGKDPQYVLKLIQESLSQWDMVGVKGAMHVMEVRLVVWDKNVIE